MCQSQFVSQSSCAPAMLLRFLPVSRWILSFSLLYSFVFSWHRNVSTHTHTQARSCGWFTHSCSLAAPKVLCYQWEVISPSASILSRFFFPPFYPLFISLLLYFLTCPFSGFHCLYVGLALFPPSFLALIAAFILSGIQRTAWTHAAGPPRLLCHLCECWALLRRSAFSLSFCLSRGSEAT